jgi:hypothetical protein
MEERVGEEEGAAQGRSGLGRLGVGAAARGARDAATVAGGHGGPPWVPNRGGAGHRHRGR